MPIKVDRARHEGVEVPTMEEFRVLVNGLLLQLQEVQAYALKNGDSVALVSTSRGEAITWITGGGEVKSLPAPTQDQYWFINRHG